MELENLQQMDPATGAFLQFFLKGKKSSHIHHKQHSKLVKTTDEELETIVISQGGTLLKDCVHGIKHPETSSTF